MCLVTSNNLSLVLQDAQTSQFFPMNSWPYGQLNIDSTTHFSILHHLPPVIFANTTVVTFVLLAILGSTSIVIHSVIQRLLSNRPRSGSCDILRLLAWKIMKGIHFMQTSCAELPSSGQVCVALAVDCVSSWYSDSDSDTVMIWVTNRCYAMHKNIGHFIMLLMVMYVVHHTCQKSFLHCCWGFFHELGSSVLVSCRS